MKKFFAAALFAVFAVSPLLCQQPRGFNDVFPELSEETRTAAFSADGYLKSSTKAEGWNLIHGNLDPAIAQGVLDKDPVFLIESLLVIPGGNTLLEVYNALGKVRELKGRLYQSHSRGGSVPLFEDATRIQSERRTTPAADPAPASSVPQTETIYLKLKDVNFGASYYRADMSLDQYGLRYSLSNNKNLSYLFVTVIKQEKFTTRLYFEPIREGILLYSIAGADVSDFISKNIDMPSAIGKRLKVITSWVADGLREQN